MKIGVHVGREEIPMWKYQLALFDVPYFSHWKNKWFHLLHRVESEEVSIFLDCFWLVVPLKLSTRCIYLFILKCL